MKRTYLAKRNALLSTRSVSWGAAALLILLVVSVVRFGFPNLFWTVCAPVFTTADTIASAMRHAAGSFGDVAALAARNEKLAAENAALSSENRALMKKLDAYGSLSGSRTADSLFAGVVARPPESPYDTLMLAAGTTDGVTVGMEAFGAGGVPVGFVTTVLADFSQVTLFSAHGVTTGAWVGAHDTPLTLEGAGAGAFVATASRSAGIAEGDVVFVPGPGMLPIGSVKAIDSDPLSPSITLRIAPAVNPFTLGWVELRDTGIKMPTIATSTP